MEKKEARKIYRAKRAALEAAETMKLQDLILIQFQQLKLEVPDVLLSYAASEKLQEYDPAVVDEYCFFKNPALQLAYPVIMQGDKMVAVVIKEDTAFSQNDYGIEEPVDGTAISPENIDMVFVPLLAFDIKGNRVGYGKGYYDKFLGSCKPGCIKIGFSFFEPEKNIDVKDFDIQLDYCITPSRVYSFQH